MPSALQTTMLAAGKPALRPEQYPGAVLWLDTSRSTITKSNVVSGTGVSLTKSGSTITLTGATGLVPSHAGTTITLGGYGAGNNGKFTLLTATTGGGTFTNAAGASESGSGSKTWIVDGLCTGITDLVTGLTLAQPGAITTQMPVNTSENAAGKPVFSQGASATARYVALANPASLGALNGPGPHTYFSYFSPVTFNSGLTPLFFRDTAIGVAPGSYAYFSTYGTATTGLALTYYQTSANGTTWYQHDTFNFPAGTWHSLAAVNNGTGTVSFYVDGAYHAQMNSIVRSLVSMSTVAFGFQNAAGLITPGSVGHTKLAGAGAWVGDLGAARIAELHASFRSWQP